MDLNKIQDMESVNEIYEYILMNSCKFESINRNLKKCEWYEYGLENFHVYLCNTYVNKAEIESSLDLLFMSNAKAFKFIYSQEEDLENIIEQSRVVIYYLFLDYFNGIYDNEVYRTFGFRVNRDIEMFKKLFLKENVDIFCSHLLTKAKQEERRQLSNRVVKAVKGDDGRYKTIVEYENCSFVSYEQSFEEGKQDIDSYLYEKGQLQEEEIIKPYRNDNIYSFMVKNLHLLTDKQQEFIRYYSNVDINKRTFKTDDEMMSRELKYKYIKNIINNFQNKLFTNSEFIKKTSKGYFVLVKSDSSFLLSKILECEDRKEQFEMISGLLKRNDEIGRLLNELIIDNDCMRVFAEYCEEGFTRDVYRFIYGRKFELILNNLDNKDKGDDENVISRENKSIRSCI